MTRAAMLFLLLAGPVTAQGWQPNQPTPTQPPPPSVTLVPGGQLLDTRPADRGIYELRDARGRYQGELRPDGTGGYDVRGQQGEHRGDLRPR